MSDLPSPVRYSLTIQPPSGWSSLRMKELWLYRELAYFFVWRDLKVRYKQTILGGLWAVFQPFIAMVVFSVFFGTLLQVPSNGIPYPIFVYTGLVLWNYFSFGLSHASNSMIENSGIIQKIYFPRLIIPIASSLTGLIDFCIAAVILGVLMLYYHVTPHLLFFAFLPLLLFMTFLSSVGLGSLLASLNVKYRDVRYIIPFFIQILLFMTPVIYPVSIVAERLRWVVALNPMSAVIESARSLALGTGLIDLPSFLISLGMSIILFVAGILYFRKTERFFADII